MNRERVIIVFFFGFLAVVTYELYALFEPFLTPIAWAILLAFLAHPALTTLNGIVKNRTVCAAILTIAIALGVVLPAIWLSARLLHEAQSLYSEISTISRGSGFSGASDWVRRTHLGAKSADLLASHGVKLEDEMRTVALRGAKALSDYVVIHGGTVATNIASFVFHFAIALLTFFYLLRDGETYYEGLRDLTPLHEEDKAAIFDTLRLTLSSVMRGLMLTSLLDGVVLGIGYLVLGVPYWALLALASAAAGLVPFGGTALIWVPVSIYLGIEAGWGSAVALIIWAAVALIITDNFVKPVAMRHGTNLPTLALFFGLAGGIGRYGPIGIFAGPAVVAVFAALLRVYRKTYITEPAITTAIPAQINARSRRRRFRR
ncbi:MAG: AI-2E family transporter [Deltaproteobacteria bacterium]|nr:AI-2E family transporter [Deltaproteobacteria bacterium]